MIFVAVSKIYITGILYYNHKLSKSALYSRIYDHELGDLLITGCPHDLPSPIWYPIIWTKGIGLEDTNLCLLETNQAYTLVFIKDIH